MLRALDKWLCKDEMGIVGRVVAVHPRGASTTHSASPPELCSRQSLVCLTLVATLFPRWLCEEGLPILEMKTLDYIELADSEFQDDQRQVWNRT